MLWALISGLHAVVLSSSGLLAVRFALGVTEAGFVPGVVFWLGCWYPRNMQGRRFSYLFTAVSFTGAFGGLLATAIFQLDGARGISGWRWIFIVEGALSAVIGLAAFILMADYPVTASWLTEREREYVLMANEADRAQLAAEPFDRRQILSAFGDWRVYLWGVVFIAVNISVYSVILSLPSVVAGLGFTGIHATLLACPPYALSFFIVLGFGWSIDRHGHRFFHYALACSVTLAVLVVLMAVRSDGVRYAMFFLIMFMLICTIWGWISGNVAGANKRATTTGFVLSIGNIGGAVSGQIYRQKWAPRYVQGHAINVGCYVLALCAGGGLWWSYRGDNRQREMMSAEEATGEKDAGMVDMHETVANGRGTNMLGERLGDLGDSHPKFRYLLSDS